MMKTERNFEGPMMDQIVSPNCEKTLFPTWCDVYANGVRFKNVMPRIIDNILYLYNKTIVVGNYYDPVNLVAIISGNYIIVAREKA